MKKLLVAVLILFLATGCISIKEASIEELISITIHSKYTLYNHINSGYKYYLPRELKATKQDEYNEVIKSKYYDYYLYVDLVSYYNKVKENYEIDSSLYYSSLLENGENFGIINIKEQKENQLLVQIVYNYATIETVVKKNDLNEVITNSMVILSSIQYNDDIIKNLLEETILTSPEEQIKVFETETNENDASLEVEEDIYSGNEEEDYNPDVIN